MTATKVTILLAVAVLSVSGCRSYTASDKYPDIFPDYVSVTVPEGMAPLSFRMADGRKMTCSTRRDADTIYYSVRAWEKGSRKGTAYKPFPIYVSSDPIDPYIAYRLIEPNYEGWKELGIYSRELASYKEKCIVHNSATRGGCVNCHHFPGGDPSQMIFHARGRDGGTVFKNGDNFRLVNLNQIGLKRQGVYPAWHPGGRYIAFSSNATQQSFPITGTQPIEVFDNSSDLILMDLLTDSTSTYAPLYGSDALETFPAWNPDGTQLYYCSAPAVEDIGPNRAKVRYSIKAVEFRDGAFTGEPRTVFDCDTLSVSFPRIYGKWLLFTAAEYGTFPIWHREADLWLMDLESGEVRRADEVNSPDTESYHSWSSNGSWIVFSSRRIDGRYTRLYFSHFDGQGHFSKPFLLPQKDPEHNTLRLKSYNIPEFVRRDPGELSENVGKLFGL